MVGLEGDSWNHQGNIREESRGFVIIIEGSDSIILIIA